MMNKKLSGFLLALVLVLQSSGGFSVLAAENANISQYSAGWYDGDLSVFSDGPSSDVFAEPSYGLEILDISDDSVTFFVESVGRNGSPIYTTDQITAAVESDTARFEWADSWGNRGTGILTFEANCLILSMTETERANLNRGTLEREAIRLYPKGSGIPADFSDRGDSGVNRFERFDQSMSWEEAEQFCEERGGHLATITSGEELETVNRVLENGTKDFYWIGATDKNAEGDWEWVTGETWDFEAWSEGNPDNYKEEDYAGMLRKNVRWQNNAADRYEWNDYSNRDLSYAGFICEYESEHAAEGGSPSEWAEEEINAAREKGLIPDELDRKYQSNITRREFCLLASALMQTKTGTGTDEILKQNGRETDADVFSDTSDRAVLAMDALDVVSGDGDGRFRPENTITREEAAAMLTRLAKVLNGKLPSGATLPFSDAAQVSEWAYYPVMFISNTEDKQSGKMVMQGTGNNSFEPAETYTREQAFLSFGRLCGALEDCEPDEIRLEDAVSAEDIKISSEMGYLTGVYNLTGDGKRALWLKSEEGEEYSDTIVVRENGRRMSADKFEVWLRPMNGNELPVRLEDGATVTAFQAGPAVLTVQSPVSGTIWESFYVYACDITSRFLLGTNGRMPVREIDRLPANFYCAGMYVDSYDARQTGGEWQVTMNVYNSTAIYGAVDIYDAQGNYLRSERIKKHPTLPDGIADTLADGWGVIADTFTGEALTYRQDSYATESKLSFRVPEGGMLVFSNNAQESPGAAVFNFTDLFVEGLSAAVQGASMTKTDADKVSESFSAALLEALKEKCSEPTEEGMKSVIQWANSSYDAVSITELSDTIVNDGINGMKNLGVDAVQIFMKCAGDILSDSIVGVLESAFENAAGPAGMVLKGMFYLTDVGNYVVQLDHYKESMQAPQLHVVYPAGVEYLEDGRAVVDSIRVS